MLLAPSLNGLFAEVGLVLDAVRLVRHQAVARPSGITPYTLWHRHDGSFERYQSLQKPHTFGAASVLASFVVSPRKETIFTGLYRVLGSRIDPEAQICPLQLQKTVSPIQIYQLEAMLELEHLAGRLVIDWGQATRTWVQIAARQNKTIIAIDRSHSEPAFPGYSQFRGASDALSDIPHLWQTALAAVRGVYLLVCTKTGQQYVGSATGSDGFWGRWQAYADGGHGGNFRLRERGPSTYAISILEIAPLNATPDMIFALESLWKQKLGSRAYGLNAN